MSAHRPLFAAQWLLVAATLGVVWTASAAGASKSLAYKWVDDQGVVHYGDRVPPQYTQKDREILNSQGIEVKKLEAQKSPEQIATEALQQQELVKQKQHDSFLMTTYTSVKDIEALRDERLEQLRAQRTAAELYVETIRSRLSSLQGRARDFRPYNAKKTARRMPDDLAEDLVRTLNEMRTQNNALVARGQEEMLLKTQFQADIERYRALHALPSTR